MALALQNAGIVRQKTRAITLDPSVFYTLKSFFLYWATNKGNADLQLFPVGDADATTAGGAVIADAPASVYVVYIKKGATATDSYFKLFDDVTDDTTTTDQRLSIGLLEANEEHVVLYPKGLTMATGVVVTSHTQAEGATDSTAGDSGSGFIIVGAAGSN
jgi:hypothetical protein